MIRIAPAALVVGALCVGCHSADPPHPGTARSFTTEIGSVQLRGVAGDGAFVVSARGDAVASEIEARRGEAIAWHVTLPGSAGPLACGSGLVAATLTTTGTPAIGSPIALHGEPSSVAVAIDAASGAVRWRVPFDSLEFAVITSIAPIGAEGFVVGGTFSGTLRVGDTHLAIGARTVVSSAGRTDGFVASLTATGGVRWVVRVGGPGADSIQGVAARGDRIAVAGVFTAGAELLGEPLAAFDEKLPFGDGFVAELDTAGVRRWQQTFGGKLDDAVAGVAIDTKQRVVVAATVRDSIRLAGRDLTTRGPADGLVAWFSPAGDPGAATIVGGAEFDGLRGIAAVDDRVVVAGFFAGAVTLGKRTLDANGGDDAFLVQVNAAGELETSWHAGGPGREEITALTEVPGGFVAGVSHTAALRFEEVRVESAGAALVGRAAP